MRTKKRDTYSLGHKVLTVVEVLFMVLMQVVVPFQVVQPAAAAPLAQDAPAPTIQSDKADYTAGSTVTLTGKNWAVGETVHIVVNDTIGQTWQHVIDVTSADGTIVDVFSLPTYFVSDYDVTAKGPTSGIATTTFTDAPAQANLDQCRNGSAASPNDCKDLGGNSGWVNGNVGASQAHMLEGYSTPFRAVMTNLPTGSPISLIIGYDITASGGRHSYDYLTSIPRYDPHTFFGHPAENTFPTDGVTGFNATTSTFPIPAPSSAGSPMAGQPTNSFNSLPAAERVMTLYGGTISAISYVSQGSLTANQSETQISVTFTPENPTAVLAWGGHIAQCSVWGTTNGTCNSAGGVSGSDYHMRLINWGPNLPNLGNTDRSMAASVVVQPGNLTLAKSLTGGPNGYTGPFTINYDCGVGYSGSVSVNAGSSQTVNGIPSGSVCTISETPPTPPTGYTFGTPTFSPSNTVTIGAGTTVLVTTNNTLTRDLGSLKLTKSLIGGPNGYTGPFTIHYNCGVGFTGDVSVAAGSFQTVNGIPTGSICTVSEPAPVPLPGYTFGTPTFTDSSGTPNDGIVTIDTKGATVEVTTNNTLTRNTGSLKLSKSLTGGPGGYTGPFTIHYDCGVGFTGDVSVAAGSFQTVSGIPAGTSCTVSEPTLPTPPAGYTFGTPTFSPSASVTIDADTTVEVTTNNTLSQDTGSLKISKSLSNPDGASVPASFTINYDCGAPYVGSVSVAAGGSATVSDIPTGFVCTVSEPAPTPIPGYTWGTPVVTGSPATIGKNTTVEVSVANSITRDLGNFKITKSTSNPDGATLPTAFTGTYDCGTGYTGNFSVANGASQTVTGIPTGNTCSVVETAPAAIPGYTWGTPTYTPATIVISDKDGTFEIVVANSITRDRGNFKITKHTDNPDGATLPAAFTGTYDCGSGYTGNFSVANGASQTVTGIPTGNTCSVVETAPAAIPGYTWGPISYTPATIVISDKDGTFEIVVGNSITRDRGSFKVTKHTDNPDGATLPAAFTGTYDCGSGYTGNFSVANGASQTVTGIPTGNTCSVVETAPVAIPGYTWGTPTYTPTSITIDTKGGTFEIVVANSITRDRGNFKITKSTSNPDGATLPTAFTGTYDCGTGYTGNFSVADGASQTVTGIPTGNTCSVAETAPAAIPGYTWGTPTYTPATIVISDKDGTFEIVVANSITRDRGNFKITKHTDNPDGATLPAAFTGTYDCGSGYIGNFSVANGASQTVTGIPTGNTCSVVETAPAAIPGYTWGTPTYTPATIVISDKGGTFEIVVGNSITRDLGNFKITKSTSNPDGATLPAAFTGTYDCGTGYTGNFSVADGASQTVTGIPTGNTCSVVETAPVAIPGYTWGTPTYTPTSITIDTKGGTFEIVVSNSITHDRGSFKVTKHTDNPDGATLPAAFTGTYDCGTGYTGNFSVANGASQTVTGIPTGNTCSVVETAPVAIPGYTWGTPTYTPTSITIDTKGGTFEIVVGNSITRDRGSLQIVKTLSNLDSAPVPATFSVNYDCGTGYTGQVSVAPGSPATVSGIPTGNTCTVTEVAPTPITGYTWGTITYNPASVVISTKGDTFSITVGNSITRDRGSLVLAKSLSGGPASYTGPFTIHWDCNTFGSGDATVAAGDSATVSGIPTGTSCTVSEPTLPTVTGYTFGTPTFSPSASVIILSGNGSSVTVTTNNTLTRDTGSLKITKSTSNPDGATLPAAFTGTYDCGGTYTGSFSVADGASQTVTGIPTGNTCSVVETAPAAIPGYTWGPIIYTPTSIPIDTKGGTFEIVVSNSITHDRGSFKVTKHTDNPDGATLPAAFTGTYDCGTGYTGNFSVANGASQTVTGIPTGNTCSVVETAPVAIPGFTWGTPTYTPTSITIDTKGGTFEIVVGNSITRDRGSLQILKTLSNPDGAPIPATFSVNYDCGSGYTGSVSVAPGSTATVNGIPTGNTCTVTEVAPTPIPNYTWGTITYTPALVVISTKGGMFSITVGNSITRDRGTIIIKKVTKPTNTGSFAFTTTGAGYNGFTLPGGGQNSQTLPTGTYTVKEGTQPGWILTGIGGSTDPNTPYACTVTGSGGSSGVGDLNTQTATISLKNGDTVTCVFENTGQGVTRTQGFWATHTPLANAAWFGGTASGHTFPGVASVSGIGNTTLCGRPIDTLGEPMGGFWSDISKTSTGTKRSSLDQARMQLLQQLLAAELNASAFGSAPAGGSGQFAAWEAAYCGTNTTAIKNAQQGAASFNTAGDSGTFTPGTSADSKHARAIADKVFWDVLP